MHIIREWNRSILQKGDELGRMVTPQRKDRNKP